MPKPSSYPTRQHPASHFVESCGLILFHLSTAQICLLRHPSSSPVGDKEEEYLLPKGRRNMAESRHACALREVREETGYTARLLPVDMYTRATTAGSEGGSSSSSQPEEPDKARLRTASTEAFMLTQWELPGGGDTAAGVKLIWWFVGQIDESVEKGEGDETFAAELVGVDEVREKVTFSEDCEIVEEAVRLVRGTYGPLTAHGASHSGI